MLLEMPILSIFQSPKKVKVESTPLRPVNNFFFIPFKALFFGSFKIPKNMWITMWITF